MRTSTVGLIAAFCATTAVPVFAANRALPPTVPQGVTLVEVSRDLELSQPEFLWNRPGDASGRTLFTAENDGPGVARCVDACAAEFPPLLAPAGAKPMGDWSLVRRPEGAMQWSYQARPLYVWSKEKNPGEVATNVGLTETATSKLAEGRVRPTELMPPKGWQVARFTPAAPLALPDGIDARINGNAQATVLTDSQGRTLYALDGEAKRDNQICSDRGCDLTWLPVTAPGLAVPVGDFTVVSRADGSSQWSYKKQPLYRYSGDLLPGDVHGGGVDKKWKVAALSETFRPAKVSVANIEGYGTVLSVNGMTLYGGHAMMKLWGGRNLRDGYRDLWSKGKKLGGAACESGRCTELWRPFLAPAGAEPNGFWEIYTRADGSKQWAYKGFALYTNSGDKISGQISGQSVYEFAKLGGTDKDLDRKALLDEISGDRIYGGAGIYWTVARP